jgi:hypothetical protein
MKKKKFGLKYEIYLSLASNQISNKYLPMRISQIYSDFNSEVTISVPYINTNQLPLKVTATQATELTDFLTDWNTLWAKYIDPTQHTDTVVHDVINLYHNFHSSIQGIKAQIKNNKSITLTEEIISKVHIHVDAPHRAAVPVPGFAPVNQLIKSTHLVNKIWTFNPQPGMENETSMPIDVVRIARKMAVVADGVTPSAENYHAITQVGVTMYDIVFSPEQEGAMAWLITSYVNHRGQEGPSSPPFKFRII